MTALKIIQYLSLLGLIILLLSLSYWQWTRAHEKQLLLTQQTQKKQAEPLYISNLQHLPLAKIRYQNIVAVGHYDTQHTVLIDNQISAGKAGYFVLTPFILNNSTQTILVNRGWVLMNPDRRQLPTLGKIEPETLRISGRINYFPSVGIKLKGADLPTNTEPTIVQIVNTEILGKKLAQSLYPFQLELNQTEAYGFKREWTTTTLLSPEQHIAYAIQWLLLALTLTLLFLWFNFKKNDSTTKK